MLASDGIPGRCIIVDRCESEDGSMNSLRKAEINSGVTPRFKYRRRRHIVGHIFSLFVYSVFSIPDHKFVLLEGVQITHSGQVCVGNNCGGLEGVQEAV